MDADRASLESLYREEGPAIWNYLRRRVADADADEILQETFLVVARDMIKIQLAESPKAWLLAIARNLLREHFRSHGRAARIKPRVSQAAVKGAEDDRLDAVRRNIDALPESQRAALELKIVDGLNYLEISEMLKIPLGTVRSRIHYAIQSLRSRLGANVCQAREERIGEPKR